MVREQARRVARWVSISVVAVSAGGAAAVLGGAEAGAAPGDTIRLSVSSAGAQGDGPSPPDSYLGPEADITPDGRFVAFPSSATNLVPGDTNGRADIFVHDRLTATTERVSVGTNGQQGDVHAAFPSISADGRFVAFESRDLGFGADGVLGQVYVRDRQAGTTFWVSEKPPGAGVLDSHAGSRPSISADGRYVSYTTNGVDDFYGAGDGSFLIVVRDLQTGAYDLASRTDADGVPTDPGVITGATVNDFSDLSADGRFVAFQSTGTNLVAGDTNGQRDVFVRDRQLGTTVRVNVTDAGGQGDHGATTPKISADGTRVAFWTGDQLTGTDPNIGEDVYVRDLAAGTTLLVSATPAGTASTQQGAASLHAALSPDGGHVAFWSTANDLVAADTDINPDLFVRSLASGTTQLASVASDGAQPGGHVHITVGLAHDPALSAGGAVVAFGSRSDGLVPADTNTARDVFVRELPGLGATSRFVPLAPARILDTRIAEGAPPGKPGPDSTLDVQVTGRAGVPDIGVSAVVLNVTATEATDAGFVTVWPSGQERPLASNLNLERPGQTIPNLVVVPVGAGGRVSIFTQSGAHLLADVAGYFAPATTSAGGRLVPVTPARLLDTRVGEGAPPGKPGPEATVDLQVTGRGGVPHAGVSAVVLNVTATEATDAGFVTVWPAGLPRPNASNLNLERPDQTIPNLVMVPVGEGGRVLLSTQSGTHLLADVAGWFTDDAAPPGAAGLFVPVTPARVLDTREGNGAPPGPLAPDATLDLVLAARGGLPAGGLGAVVLNVTATEAAAPGFVTAWPTGLPRPLASNLNLERPGQTIPNAAVVPVGAGGGSVSFYSQAGTHLVADTAGWFLG